MVAIRIDHCPEVLAGKLNRRRVLGGLSALPLSLSSSRLAAWQRAVAPTLLVRGETELVAGAAMAWRVVRDVAEVGSDAVFELRALGFAVATNPFGSLLLTDEATGSASHLAPGEAAFLRDGTFQRRESLGDSAQGYLRIGLVEAAAANDADGDRLIFSGPPFPTPTGPVTLALHRVELGEGETFGMAPGAGESETLVLVEQGGVELEIGEAAPRELLRTTVGSDTAYAIRSVEAAAMLYGAEVGTSVLVATIT